MLSNRVGACKSVGQKGERFSFSTSRPYQFGIKHFFFLSYPTSHILICICTYRVRTNKVFLWHIQEILAFFSLKLRVYFYFLKYLKSNI